MQHLKILFKSRRFIPITSGALKEISKRSMSSKKATLAKRYQGPVEENVWVRFVGLCNEHKAFNLGQGFPDEHCHEMLRHELGKVAGGDNPFLNQYTRSYGHPRLVNILAKVYSHLMQQSLEPTTNILVTIGGYQALFSAIQSMVDPGDEVIIIEPFFDCFQHHVRIAGGKPVFVPLRPQHAGSAASTKDWILDPTELRSAFSQKTRMLILNTPNNPLGKVFRREELELIASLCIEHDIICLSDEVYEWLVYDGSQHIRIATLPRMWERTVTIGSAGKTFNCTGWKTGWAVGPANLIRNLGVVHQNCIYTCPTPIQEALARAYEYEFERLNTPQSYFSSVSEELHRKRDEMASILGEVGMIPVMPEGGYFMMADYSKIEHPKLEGKEPVDSLFVQWMIREKKIAAIPPSYFYSDEHKHLAANYVRFCFFKKDETLKEARQMFQQWLATADSAAGSK